MTEPRLSRRQLVGAAAAGAGALALASAPLAGGARRRGVPIARTGSFAEGVASGEPTTDGITLWTRLGGYTRDRKLYLEISSEPDFRKTLYRRNVVARAANDHTVKVRVAARKFMKPGERYYYRFETRDRESPVGRFKLARPADSREPVRIAFWSCQDWEAGYYGAHRTIAEIDDLDLVVCLGDYIYERSYYEGPRKDTLGKNGDAEVQTLPEYRQKYRLYRSDADLQAMHAAHPFTCIWDDHEVEDNYAGDKPGTYTQDKRVEFLERRANGYRSFFDYMPMRRVRGDGDRLYRALRLGRTAEVFLLDQRQYRDDQPCGDELFVPCPEAENEPRRYLGDAQKEWLKSSLQASDASWKIVGNQLMVMSLDSGPNQPINKDSWDGYGVERREVLQHVQEKQIADIAFLTGDIHTFFAGDVGVDGRGPESVATEFVGGSITSLGIPETFQGQGAPLSREQILAVTQNIRITNPHLKYDEQLSRGYGLLTASDTELAVEFKAVEARERTTEAKTIGSFRVKRGEPRVETL